MFAVDNIEDVLARFQTHGAELVGRWSATRTSSALLRPRPQRHPRRAGRGDRLNARCPGVLDPRGSSATARDGRLGPLASIGVLASGLGCGTTDAVRPGSETSATGPSPDPGPTAAARAALAEVMARYARCRSYRDRGRAAGPRPHAAVATRNPASRRGRHFDEEARAEHLREPLRGRRGETQSGGHEEGAALGAEVVGQDHSLAQVRGRDSMVGALAESRPRRRGWPCRRRRESQSSGPPGPRSERSIRSWACRSSTSRSPVGRRAWRRRRRCWRAREGRRRARPRVRRRRRGRPRQATSGPERSPSRRSGAGIRSIASDIVMAAPRRSPPNDLGQPATGDAS